MLSQITFTASILDMNQISKIFLCLVVLFATVSAFQSMAKHTGFALRLSAVKKADGKVAPKTAAAAAKKSPVAKKAVDAKNVDAIYSIFHSRSNVFLRFHFDTIYSSTR